MGWCCKQMEIVSPTFDMMMDVWVFLITKSYLILRQVIINRQICLKEDSPPLYNLVIRFAGLIKFHMKRTTRKKPYCNEIFCCNKHLLQRRNFVAHHCNKVIIVAINLYCNKKISLSTIAIKFVVLYYYNKIFVAIEFCCKTFVAIKYFYYY